MKKKKSSKENKTTTTNLERRGVARQALVKNWLIDKIDEAKKGHEAPR